MKRSGLQEEVNNMKIFAVIDTNIIVSALISKHSDSATVLILESIFIDAITPIYNGEILDEYNTVLRRGKFNFSENRIKTTLETIVAKGIHSERLNSGEILPDPKDLVFYEVALSKEDSFLVTGNIKHFPKKPFIVTPSEMLTIISEIESSDNKLLNETREASYGSLSRL
jgi:putative PIN family toxin of toxin-antitoxin system